MYQEFMVSLFDISTMSSYLYALARPETFKESKMSVPVFAAMGSP